jgi:hypothetical protein
MPSKKNHQKKDKPTNQKRNQNIENYKKAMIEASKDKLYREDMKEIEKDFRYIDFKDSINT